MRYAAEHKRQTRERVLKAAGRQIRDRGAQGIALVGVMADAGLTQGGFYAHFASKDDFLAAAVEQMFEDSPIAMILGDKGQPVRTLLIEFLEFYLSPEHRDTRTGGCPLPFLTAEAPRLPPDLRARLSQATARMIKLLSNRLEELGRPNPEEEASSIVSEIIGAVVLARAEPDPQRSDALLARSRASVRRRLELENQ